MKATKNRLIAIALPMALVASLGIGSHAVAKDMPYLTDSSGDSVLTGFGKCWNTVGGVANRVECGDAPPDADHDGVPDSKDKCPDTPAGVAVDDKGCPVDSDGDGVADYRDQCPGTPAGAKVDTNGCPADSDGDGVADYRDKCLGTAAGAKVDADGCDIISNVVIDSVQADFDYDKADLKPAMQQALDDVAAKLQASRGEETIVIVGHTDSIGSNAYNQKLSERRANAVADYLTGKGIDRSRMTISGKGEAEPVADNKTNSGRSQNRRIEIRTK